MNVRFSVTAPKTVDLTLKLNASVSEWQALASELEAAGPAAMEFARKLSMAIREATKDLSVTQWTTGYASGAAEDEA